MVSQSYTAVVERAQGLKGVFAMEPYEAGWAHEATAFPTMTDAGLYFVRVDNFGSWLRVAGEVVGADASANVHVYIALKD